MGKPVLDPISKALAQALLDHHRRVCHVVSIARNEIAESAVRGCTVTYLDLILSAKVQIIPQAIGKPLKQVARWCANRGWPPLHALAVHGGTGNPGPSYVGSPATTENWIEDAKWCISFREYPEFA